MGLLLAICPWHAVCLYVCTPMPLITLLVNLLSKKTSRLSDPSEPHMPILPYVSSESHISNLSVTLENLWESRFGISVEYFEHVPVCHRLKQSVLLHSSCTSQGKNGPQDKLGLICSYCSINLWGALAFKPHTKRKLEDAFHAPSAPILFLWSDLLPSNLG